MAKDRTSEDELTRLADLIAALAEHVVDVERRITSIETHGAPPKRIAASDLRRISKELMTLSILRRRREQQP
jgi:hypothetical protein